MKTADEMTASEAESEKADDKGNMSVSSSISEDFDQIDSNGDQIVINSPIESPSKSLTESQAETEGSKPTLLCAEKIWHFPVSSEYKINITKASSFNSNLSTIVVN